MKPVEQVGLGVVLGTFMVGFEGGFMSILAYLRAVALIVWLAVLRAFLWGVL